MRCLTSSRGHGLLGRNIGELQSSHLLDDVTRPDATTIAVGDATWTLFGARSKELNVALREAGIELELGNRDAL